MALSHEDTGESGVTDDGGVDPTALDDVAFLARSPHRVAALDAMAERPQTRSDLRATTGVSPSTMGRTLGAFEERNWVRRDGHEYAATALGAFVASGMRALIERMETERTLRDVWRWLPTETVELPLEPWADAAVTVAEAAVPYRPINRFRTLLRGTDRFRFVGFDLGLLEPCRDDLRRQVLEGSQVEIIDPPSVASYVLSTYDDHCAGPLESGNLSIRVHDDLPSCGIGLFDDRVGVSAYDAASGTVQAFADTDAPAAREWAEATYESYRRESRPLAHEATA